LTLTQATGHEHNEKSYVHRISMSLFPKLLAEFDKSMIKAGFTHRSKAIQTALHSFVDEYNWVDDLPKSGAGAIIMIYDNHVYTSFGEDITTSTHQNIAYCLPFLISLTCIERQGILSTFFGSW
jgi:metal-responsive CopG/Arc/MetJ family transcriptional regulator